MRRLGLQIPKCLESLSGCFFEGFCLVEGFVVVLLLGFCILGFFEEKIHCRYCGKYATESSGKFLQAGKLHNSGKRGNVIFMVCLPDVLCYCNRCFLITIDKLKDIN